ncbi:MAG: ribonuclease P protein component [Parvibaculaceae bacterium]
MKSPLERLKRRRDFLAASRAPSWAARGVVVQRCERGDGGPARVGFTATRKLGGAVTRNRIRRRLKEAVRLTVADRLGAGADYVFIARAAGLERSFASLKADVRAAVERLVRQSETGTAPKA